MGAVSGVRASGAVLFGGSMQAVRQLESRTGEGQEAMTTYTEEALNLAELVIKKQMAYGDSFGRSQEIMQVLYPNGIRADQYLDALAVIRVIDKLFRIANQKTAFGEDPWRDIAGYGLLSVVNTKNAI